MRRHGTQQALEMQRTAANIAKTLRDKENRSKWVLHPDKNKYLPYWDALTSAALVYTATLTPFETAFIPPVGGAAAWGEPWFIANRILDIIFLADLVVQFFVAYQTGSRFGGRVWVTERRRVQVHYLRTWFLSDAITVFVPGGFDLYLASMAPVDSAEQGLGGGGGGLQTEQGTPAKLAERASFLRMMRILRLVKLLRLVRASRLIERQIAKISVASGTLTIVKIVLAMAVFVHWYACIITLNVTLHTEADQTWVALFGFCHDGMSQKLSQEPNSEAGMAAGSAPLAGCDSALSIGRWYLAAVSWSSQLITGTGGTG